MVSVSPITLPPLLWSPQPPATDVAAAARAISSARLNGARFYSRPETAGPPLYSAPVKVGVLTAGGDCPGLNAVIRAVTRRSLNGGHEVRGVRRGYQGLAEGTYEPLDMRAVSGILPLGGTILSTSSFDPYREPEGVARVKAALERDGFDGIVAIGGEHTMSITRRLWEDERVPLVGVPKTIDNDVPGTDFTFGFDTAVQIASDAIDRLHTTAQAHDRVMVVEVMGRNTGWIAVFSGIAGGADAILIPELELSVEQVCEAINTRHERGKNFSIVVVAEGAQLSFGSGERRRVRASEETDAYGYPRLGGIGQALAKEIEARTGFETRVTILGHVQRGGTPTATDRVLATRYGIKAAELCEEGRFGEMAALRGDEMTSVPLIEVEGVKRMDLDFLRLASTFFG
jgi:ATP-dependent phosphofructokinase / diphosphate-dependent phosphofructokinase